MRKHSDSKILSKLIVCSVLILSPVIAVAQQDKVTPPMPSDVRNIVQKSCIGCHGKDGKILARWKVNFTKWEGYSADEKAKKSHMICSMISDGKMPPKEVREKRPDLVPTREQADLVCKWADSLKIK